MDSTRLLRIVVVVVAVLLQLAAQPGLGGSDSPRRALPGDVPALVRNQALDSTTDGVAAVLLRAPLDPASTWDPAGDIVGRSRFRPISVALFVVERAVGRTGVLALAGLVSLLLHVVVALSVIGLTRDLGGSRGALWLAGLFSAAAPAALVVSAWPAQQATVLAAALGVVGLRFAIRSGRGLQIAGGSLLATACLAHEAALGLAAAAVVLVLLGRARGARIPWAAVLSVAVPVGLAVGARAVALSGAFPAPVDAAAPGILDAAVGMLVTLLAPLLPSHLHVAGEPWGAATWARWGCPLVLVGAAVLFVRAAPRPNAVAWAAALAAASPVLATAFTGGSPFQHGYVYMVLPVLALAVGGTLAAGAARGGALRIAAAAAGALLLGASVAGTMTAAPVFADPHEFVERAARADPSSELVEAWRIGQRVNSAPASGVERGQHLLDVLPAARALAVRLVDADGVATTRGRVLRRDAASSVAIASTLSGYAAAFVTVPAEDLPEVAAVLLPDLDRVAAASAAVAPDWGGAWLVLVRVRAAVGANSEALAAARRAAALDPDDVQRQELVARMALTVGRTELAMASIESAAVLELAAADLEGREPRREHLLLRAEIFAADAAVSGLLAEYGWAVELLMPLVESGDRGRDLRSTLYNTYLLWGDGLASLDRTAPARVAYERAVQLGGDGSEAAIHLGWLIDRLRDELKEAQDALNRAAAGQGNIANALLGLAIVQCRVGEWDVADQIFAKIEQEQGGMNPGLRYTRAIHRFAAREDELDRAASELRQVLEADPTFLDARYRLAGVLLEAGQIEQSAEEYRRAAREGAAYEWAIEALDMAYRLEEVLARSAR